MYISRKVLVESQLITVRDNENIIMASVQRRDNRCLGFQRTTEILRQTDFTDCVDDDFETLIERSNRMKSEKNRLDTYTTWPLWSNQRPERLAEAGLYYTGVADRVQCPFCYGVLKRWDSWDVPMSEHGRHFPYCRFIQGEDVGNVPIDNVTVTTEPTVLNQAASQNPDFTKETNRLVTYLRWPPNLSQTPEVLASAGFYHIPCDEKPDRVKCGYCQGKLYNWNLDDDPWVEHARCFPKCPYVKLCVDDKVVQDHQKEKTVSRQDNQTSGVNCHNSTPERDETTSRMRSEAVRAVLEMGFSKELVEKVVEKYSKEGRSESISAEDLAGLVLEMEEPEARGTNISSHNSQTTNACASEHRKPRDNQVPVCQTTTTSTGAKTSTNPEHVKSIRKENASLRNQYLCKICMENQVTVTFMPCGHLACCGQCSMAISECPVCRSAITGYVRTYF